MARYNPIYVITLGIFGLFVISIFFLPPTQNHTAEITLDSFNQLANKDEFFHHVEDMQRLQKSIISELSQLEQKRNKLKASVTMLETHSKEFEAQSQSLESSIAQLKADVHNMLMTQSETLKDYPPISLPHKLKPGSSSDSLSLRSEDTKCRLDDCFDYSRCSMLSKFPIYLYPITTDEAAHASWKMSILNSRHYTNNPEEACMFFVINEAKSTNFQLLPYWRGDGHNHVIINTSPLTIALQSHRAMLAQVDFNGGPIAEKFDVFLPYLNINQIKYDKLPLLLPVRRENLMSYYGNVPTTGLGQSEQLFVTAFLQLHSSNQHVNIISACRSGNSTCSAEKWCLCSDDKVVGVEEESTFIIIPNSRLIPQHQFSQRINTALMYSAIPVILGNHYELPMAEVIPWSKAVVLLPAQRVTELVYIVRNILEPDVMEYKKQGRLIFNNHLSSIPKAAETLLSLLRTRIDIPPLPAPSPVSRLIYGEANPMLTFQTKVDHVDEILGPIEDPYPSPAYERNFTVWHELQEQSQWDMHTYLYPQTPWDPMLPSDAKYYGSSYGFRPVNGGAGGSGQEFSLALGGNAPREQYTIVILTYDRAELLQQQLSQFNGLPYLNKILIVWNNPSYPAPTTQWPKLHVPIQVIKAARNTLNNRFMPYKEIETEAVLSMDDDMYLRHDEIIFAFRVWRESRDRIVGFPGRYHAWNLHDHSWNYNSNHSCELSMVLTGASFFHKYYMYQYTYEMNHAIRDKVDEFMNCEDLAMNFLVSHITGKPPIKTTSRWTFRCPTCGEEALWTDESHFNERHQCIEFFTRVYGYLPLRYTQYRADSVLFKTRVPQDKTKCFTLV